MKSLRLIIVLLLFGLALGVSAQDSGRRSVRSVKKEMPNESEAEKPQNLKDKKEIQTSPMSAPVSSANKNAPVSTGDKKVTPSTSNDKKPESSVSRATGSSASGGSSSSVSRSNDNSSSQVSRRSSGDRRREK